MRMSVRLLVAGFVGVLATAACTAPPGGALEGPTWQVSGIPGGFSAEDPPVDPVLLWRVTASFTAASTNDGGRNAGVVSGRVTGSAGCNSYFGDYVRTGDRLTITAVGTTDMACEPEVRRVERVYLDRLQRTARFRVSQQRLCRWDGICRPSLPAQFLHLIGADGTELVRFSAPPVQQTSARPEPSGN
jgi:hypothetical protein